MLNYVLILVSQFKYSILVVLQFFISIIIKLLVSFFQFSIEVLTELILQHSNLLSLAEYYQV